MNIRMIYYNRRNRLDSDSAISVYNFTNNNHIASIWLAPTTSILSNEAIKNFKHILKNNSFNKTISSINKI